MEVPVCFFLVLISAVLPPFNGDADVSFALVYFQGIDLSVAEIKHFV